MQAPPVLDPKATGLDVGSEHIHASIGGDAPRVFGTVTSQLHALRDRLQAEGVRAVAMEATGIWWLCVYAVLEEAGLEVRVVNGKHVQNLPGRKTDLKDCQWQATLHAHGLLRGGFVPPEHIRRLQDYLRLRAILAGECDLAVLLALCDEQIQKKKAERVKESLRGTWKDEHLFALEQALELWEFYQQKIAECDAQIERVVRALAGPEPPADSPPPLVGKRPCGNAPAIEGLHALLVRWCGGKDLTVLPGLADYTLQVIGEVGTDLSGWKSEKHFTSWLGLTPGSKQSGKRRGVTARQRNRAGRLFCVMARSVERTVDKALARKLAVPFWRLMVHGLEYVEHGVRKYQEQVAQTEARLLRKLAKKQGFTLMPTQP